MHQAVRTETSPLEKKQSKGEGLTIVFISRVAAPLALPDLTSAYRINWLSVALVRDTQGGWTSGEDTDMAALKPNISQKPNLPPKPCLQLTRGQNSARGPVMLDRVISRIEPGTVRQRALSLTSKQDNKTGFQWTAGQTQKPKEKQENKKQIQKWEEKQENREQIQKWEEKQENREQIQKPQEKQENREQIQKSEEKQKNKQTEDRRDQPAVNVENGRSEPDGSEMEDGLGGVRLEEAGPMTSSCSLQETHCHCLCHMQRPGMKLVWVPLKVDEGNKHEQSNGSLKREDKRISLSRGDMPYRDSKTTADVSPPSKHTAPEKSPTMPQCINCRSFQLHHGRRVSETESLYERLDVLLPSLAPSETPPSSQDPPLNKDPAPAEEPLYLELQPSIENTAMPPVPPPRPTPPPRRQSKHRQKDRRATQPVLAYMLSPRGGRPPIRSPSSCERKQKLEEKRIDDKPSEKETDGRRKISTDWVQNSDYEPLYQMYQQKVCEAEALLQCGSPSSRPCRKSVSESLGLGAPSGPRREVRLWQENPVVKESGVLQKLSYNETQRQECMFEVLVSEDSYLRSLRVLRDHFLGSRELNDTLVIHDRKSLFSNTLQVYDVSERFMQDLLDRMDESVVVSDVCDIIHQHAVKHFSVYIDYIRNQIYQEKTYTRLMQENSVFCVVMRRLEESPLCQRLPFTSFMLLPFQRITRIKILIQSILKRTAEGSAEEETASKALTAVSEIILEANSQVGQMKQMEELVHTANILEFDKLKAIPLVCQTRQLEKQGELQELSKGASLFGLRFRFSPIYIFLFNDLVILAARKSGNPERFVVLDHAHRSLVQVQRIGVSGAQLEYTFCLTLLENHQGQTCERLLKANTESDLHRWTAAFPSVTGPQQEQEKVYEDWDCPQVQCVHQYVAKQADELSLEPCDIINVIRKTSEGWWEGMRLSDRARGWFPQESVAEVTSEHQRRRNLREQYRISMATRTANHRADI